MMKLTFVLGNGFDIALGLNTRYTDFYNAFLAGETSTFDSVGTQIIHHPELVAMLEENKDNPLWADLELLLGKSIYRFNSADCLREEKTYLENSLNDYISAEQKRLVVNTDKGDEIRQALDKLIDRFKNYFDWSFKNEEKIVVQFVTFNYSDTIERIVKVVNKNDSTQNIIYEKPIYIHGKIGDRIILGLDNKSQYTDRTGLRDRINNKEVKLILEKPELNRLFRNREYLDAIRAIKDADKIILYGTSIGETDVSWWKTISKWLVDHSERSFHQLGILYYLKNSNSASITELTPLVEIERKFEQLVFEIDKMNPIRLHRRAIAVKRTEDWMFSFDNSIISIGPKRLFPGLTLR
ncbi:MAG: AbiH family protein [Bacteroidales bacterium]|nr:AbiH family protein [Bacteroidales bacterium]